MDPADTDKIGDELGGGGPVHVEVAEDSKARSALMNFESIGENCEFGLVQRRFGAEPIGLLRWAYVPRETLIRLLQNDFAGYGEPNNTEIFVANWGEFIIRDRRYGMNRHTYIQSSTADPQAVLSSETRRLKFLVRKLREDLHSDDKIFIYKSKAGLTHSEILELHRTMETFGQNRLVVVMPPVSHDNLSLEWVNPRLMVARLFGLGPTDGKWNIPFSTWRDLSLKISDNFTQCGPARANQEHQELPL